MRLNFRQIIEHIRKLVIINEDHECWSLILCSYFFILNKCSKLMRNASIEARVSVAFVAELWSIFL